MSPPGTIDTRVPNSTYGRRSTCRGSMPPSMKHGGDFFRVWGGVAGVQSTLCALLTIEPALPLTHVARYTAGNAAARFNLPDKGTIATGKDADLSLLDLNARSELKQEHLLDRHKLSPYVGRTFRGVIKRTILRGQTIFAAGKIVGPPRGKFVRPSL